MAIRSYNSEITRTASTTDVALERLRNLEIVNRFTGETLTDASNTVLGTTDNFVTPATRNVTATGVHAVIGKTIFIDAGVQLIADANNVHFQFFNCSIIYRPSGSIGSSAQPIGTGQDLNSDAIDSRVSEGAATTRSVSFYGCSFTVAPTAAANIFLQFGDVMNSTIQWGGGLHTPLPCFNVGSRAINATFLCENVSNTAVLEVYGAPEISEGLVIRNHSIEITGTGAGALTETYQQLYTSPNFTGPGNLQRWRTQDSAQGQSAFQVIGPFNPFNNVLADTVRTAAGDNGVQTFAHLRSNTGQIINYYGWQPGFFSDASQTLPIQNVAGRLRTSAEMATNTINSAGGQTSMLTAIGNTPTGYGDQTGDAKSDATVFRSNANGVLVADADTRYSSNAVASNPSYSTGWWDMLRFRPYTTAGATTGGDTLGQTWFDAAAPDNTIFGPIAQVTGTAYGQYETDIDYRSYSHDIAYTETQNGIIGTDDGNQASSTLSPIDESNFVGGSLVGVRVKTANVDAATNLPVFNFADDEPVSLNDLGNVVRAGWHEFAKDPEAVNFPDSNGIFDERNQPIRVHVYDDGSEIVGRHAGIWRVSNASVGTGQWAVRVLGNGIAAKDDDLYAELPGVTTFNFHGQSVTGSTLNVGERLNHIGTVQDVTFSSGNILDSGSSSSLYDIIFSPNDTDPGEAGHYDGTGVTITGTCSFNSGVVHPTGQPFNPPIAVGYNAAGTAVESNIMFTKGRLSRADETVNGMWDNSRWNGVSTGTGLVADRLLNIEINGGSHAMTIENVNNADATWQFRNVTDLTINLPDTTTLPAGVLVTIDTGATASDTAQRNVVKAWLTTQGITPIETRLDETHPTEGYWLIGAPEADPIPYQWVLNDVGVLDSGYWIIKNTDNDTIYNQTTIMNGVVTNPPTQVFNTTNTNYRSYLMLTSAIGGAVYKCSIQDFTSANVENANFTADLQVRTDLVNAFFTQASSQLQEGDGGNDIVAEVLAHTPGTDKLVLQWTNADGIRATETGTQAGVIQAFTTVQGVQRYVTYLAEFNRLFDLIDYQPSAMAINNSAEGVTGVASTEGVFFNSVSQSTQQKGTSASGFNSDPTIFTVPSGAGTGDTFPSATNNQFQSNTSSTLSVPNTVNAIASTLAGSGSATVGDLNELGNEIKANQAVNATNIRRASLLQPASGTIPNTAD